MIFERPTNDCYPYYKNSLFPKNHNSHDWDKAKQSKLFKFSKLRVYKSLELY